MRIGILALQGAVQDHAAPFARLGAETVEVRRPEELEGHGGPAGRHGLDGLVLPGGESTVMGRYLKEYGLVEPIRRLAAEGLPIWGLCAGAILLCREVDGRPGVLALLPARAARNAYGRQLSSFEEELDTPVGAFRGIFIRAPRLEALDGAEILSRRSVARRSAPQRSGPPSDPLGEAVLLRYKNILAASFHPELSGDDRLHRYFLDIVEHKA
jgi:pyridoxal 5'-phosphate synthase pdxT subunit